MEALMRAANEAAEFGLQQPDICLIRGYTVRGPITVDDEMDAIQAVDQAVERLWRYTVIADLIPKRD